MDKSEKFSKFLKAFGYIYFMINCMGFAVIFVMLVYSAVKHPQFSPGWIVLMFPGIGALSGYWIRTGQYVWWRSIIIVLSLICFGMFLFIVFVAGPKIEKIKQDSIDMELKLSKIDAGVERMFLGVYSGDIEIVREQLDKGVYVDARNETGTTALHVAQDPEIIKLLIANGADVNALDDMSMTPIFNKEIENLEILLDAGADIKARSGTGNTIFLWYVYSGYLEGLKFLVSKGADVNVCNDDGHNAIDIEKYVQHGDEVMKYLNSLNIASCVSKK